MGRFSCLYIFVFGHGHVSTRGGRAGRVGGVSLLVVTIIILLLVVTNTTCCVFRRGRRVRSLRRTCILSGRSLRSRFGRLSLRCRKCGFGVNGSSLLGLLSARRTGMRHLRRRLHAMGTAGAGRVTHLGGRLRALHGVVHGCMIRVSSLGHTGRRLGIRGGRTMGGCGRTSSATAALGGRGRGLARHIALTDHLSTANVGMAPIGNHKGGTGIVGGVRRFIISFQVDGGVATPIKRGAVCIHVVGPSSSVLLGDHTSMFAFRKGRVGCSVGGLIRCSNRRLPIAVC